MCTYVMRQVLSKRRIEFKTFRIVNVSACCCKNPQTLILVVVAPRDICCVCVCKCVCVGGGGGRYFPLLLGTGH